jgi:Ca2+-binding RTX toxin-like protein
VNGYLTINPVADLPDLTVQDTSGNENAAIALSIASALTDTDGSETLAIRIDSVPGDAVLSAGTNLGGGSWLLTPGQLSGLTLTKQDSGAFTLVVNAIATETANNDMATRTANLNVTVNNLAPSASVNGPTSGIRGQALTFTLGATDPSPTDQAAGFTYAIDWDGNGTTDQTVSGPDGLQVTHTYTVAGSYTVRMTATDKDGGTSSSVSQGVTIAAIGLQPDPADANLTALVIGGTTAADVIQVQKNPTGPGVRVILNGTMYGPFTPTGHIIVYAQDGSDVIQVHNQITLPTLLFGGDGNDVISGGEGQNIVVAGAGVDTVNGGGVRDLIIGGLGSDVLASKGDDDLLIAGTTSHDANEVALCAIMQEWSSGNTYEQRVANLRTGGGLNGTAVLTASTVFDDNVADILNGSMGRDWFFARLTGLNSDVADKAANEFVN